MSPGSAAVAGTFVRDVTVAVEIVELTGPAQVVTGVFVAEATLFGTLGLRWHARGIFVGVEWESRHWGTSNQGEASCKPEVPPLPRIAKSRDPESGDKM